MINLLSFINISQCLTDVLPVLKKIYVKNDIVTGAAAGL